MAVGMYTGDAGRDDKSSSLLDVWLDSDIFRLGPAWTLHNTITKLPRCISTELPESTFGAVGVQLVCLGSCEAHLGSCESHLGLCEAHLGLCEAHLGSCEAHLGSCETHLEVCQLQSQWPLHHHRSP